MSGFITKVDYSNNRQVRQTKLTTTTLSGTTIHGVDFSALTSGPDLSSVVTLSTTTGVTSTFSGDTGQTGFIFGISEMVLATSELVPITNLNSGTTQFGGPDYSGYIKTIIDGNVVNLTYTGISFNLIVNNIKQVGNTFSGTALSTVVRYSAGTTDYTGRTIWNEVKGIQKTKRLIVTDGAGPNMVLGTTGSSGDIIYLPYTSSATPVLWSSSTGTNSLVINNTTNLASGNYSLAYGDSNTASGDYSSAQGFNTTSSGNYSHTEGNANTATGTTAHAEGSSTKALGFSSHAEGTNTTAIANFSHSEGHQTTASGLTAHAEGQSTTAVGDSSHAEGYSTIAQGDYSHAENLFSVASGQVSHAEGNNTRATNTGSHSEGLTTTASGQYSHSEGINSTASGDYSHAEGGSKASGQYSHSEGNSTSATTYSSHAEGSSTIASGGSSHAEGAGSTANGPASHAEGSLTVASGYASHAEGQQTTASGDYSHAGGQNSIVSGNTSFVHSSGSTVNGSYSAILGGSGNTVNINISGSTILGGAGIIANSSNTTFVPKLNIQTLGAGPGTITLSTDANGNVVNVASDVRLKKDINTINDALNKVSNLRGVTYKWIDSEKGGEQINIGFIAQEVELIVPELTFENGGIKGVKYQDTVALLVEAIKELSTQVNELQNKLNNLSK